MGIQTLFNIKILSNLLYLLIFQLNPFKERPRNTATQVLFYFEEPRYRGNEKY